MVCCNGRIDSAKTSFRNCSRKFLTLCFLDEFYSSVRNPKDQDVVGKGKTYLPDCGDVTPLRFFFPSLRGVFDLQSSLERVLHFCSGREIIFVWISICRQRCSKISGLARCSPNIFFCNKTPLIGCDIYAPFDEVHHLVRKFLRIHDELRKCVHARERLRLTVKILLEERFKGPSVYHLRQEVFNKTEWGVLHSIVWNAKAGLYHVY